MPSILDKAFKYIPAAQTDIAATFKRVRKEMEAAKKAEQEREAERIMKVRTIGGKR